MAVIFNSECNRNRLSVSAKLHPDPLGALTYPWLYFGRRPRGGWKKKEGEREEEDDRQGREVREEKEKSREGQTCSLRLPQSEMLDSPLALSNKIEHHLSISAANRTSRDSLRRRHYDVMCRLVRSSKTCTEHRFVALSCCKLGYATLLRRKADLDAAKVTFCTNLLNDRSRGVIL